MDAIDRGCDREEEMRADAIADASRAAAGLPDIGQCHNCGAVTIATHRFCDRDCRDDYERRAKAYGVRRG